MDWKTVSFVLSGAKRKELFLALAQARTPAQLSKIVGVSVSNLWVKLQGLEKRGLVLCLTPNAKKGRIYALTKNGQQILKAVKAMEQD